jgi:hypothetical protein
MSKIIALLMVSMSAPDRLVAVPPSPSGYQLRLEQRHPWRPPFGLQRVGQPLVVVVESRGRPEPSGYLLEAIRHGKEISSYPLEFPSSPPYSVRLTIQGSPDELALSATAGAGGKRVELARLPVRLPELEADAIARPNETVNPVDLGTVLVPSGWLLLGPGQSASLDFAALCRSGDLRAAQLRAWYESAPRQGMTREIALPECTRVQQRLTLPTSTAGLDRDVLAVVLEAGGRALWRKRIPVMLVRDPPRHPRFGATYERLRYDAPISVRDPKTGAYSSLSYEKGWRPELLDVVVWLPSGGRFVFWRGSSYVPFWAGLHNTGACYEWAEIISRPEGAVDCVEPLMDKELRYARVEIVESTPARVHVRWRYQSTDFNYKVWGDQAVEDYYFYPDGFGTRVVSLKSDPKNDYELSEFIILTSQGAYPLEVLPETPVEALFLDGRKRSFHFPNPRAAARARPDPALAEQHVPAIYRLRLHQQQELAAVYFNSNETKLPPVVFAPFFDRGELVTPCYWGSHWPLARGNSTGWAIDDRIQYTPCHNSVMSWGGCRPTPIRTAEVMTLDALGRSRPMTVRCWAWLIGMTDGPDRRLRDWARSFATPPTLELQGARLDFEAYAQKRRAIRLIALDRDVRITIKPGSTCVNPVFEWMGAANGDVRVWLDGRPLDAGRFAWDGRTLWLDTTIESTAQLRISLNGNRK